MAAMLMRQRRYQSTERLKQYATDLDQILKAKAEVAGMEVDMTDRQKDRNRLQRIKELEPKLVEQIKNLRDEIAVEARKIQVLEQQDAVVKALANDFGDLANSGPDVLHQAENAVQSIQTNFANRLGLPMEIFDADWRTNFRQFVNNPQYQPVAAPPPDCFVTNDENCIKLLEEAKTQRHVSNEGWQSQSISEFIKQLNTAVVERSASAANAEKEVQTQRKRAEDAEEQRDRANGNLDRVTEEGKAWKKKFEEQEDFKKKYEDLDLEHQELRDKTKDHEQTSNKKDELEGSLQQLQLEHDELKQKYEGLESEASTLREANSGVDQLVKASNEKDERLAELQSKLEDKSREFEEEKTTSKDWCSRAAQVPKLKELCLHLVEHSADPKGVSLDVERLYPLLDVEHLLSEVQVSPTNIAQEQIVFAKWYVDYNDIDSSLSWVHMVARGLGVQTSLGGSDSAMARALALEKKILPDMKSAGQTPSSTAASVLHQYVATQSLTILVEAEAFAVICTALEAVQKWFPSPQTLGWEKSVQRILKNRYSSTTKLMTPLLEQLCIYRLSVTMTQVLSRDVLSYCPLVAPNAAHILHDDEEPQQSNESMRRLHIAEIAERVFAGQGMDNVGGVLSMESRGVKLVVIKDKVDSREYLFWRAIEGIDWVFSTSGFHVHIAGEHGNQTWECTLAGKVPQDAPSFGIKFESSKNQHALEKYLRSFHSTTVNQAFERNYQAQMAEINKQNAMELD